MRKRRSDSDIIIDVLEEAARRSFVGVLPELRQYGQTELPIVIDLIDSGKVRGYAEQVEGGLAIRLEGITLEGRQLRDELIAKRDEKTLAARVKKAFWAGLGAGGTLIVEYLKRKIGSN